MMDTIFANFGGSQEWVLAGRLRFIGEIRRCFETLGFEALEPKAKAVALPIKYFHSITVAIQEDEQHAVKHRDLDILKEIKSTASGFNWRL